MVSRLHPSRFCRSNTCALWAPRLPVASIAARLGFGRGHASPGVIHADAVVVWILRAEQHARRRRAPGDRPS